MILGVESYPKLYIEAGVAEQVLDSLGSAFWPEGAGPFEKILNLMDWGVWLIPGIGNLLGLLMMLGSVLGYNLQQLGGWLDNILELKSFDDLANISTKKALDKIVGKLDPQQLNELQKAAIAAGIINAPNNKASEILFPLVKQAKDDPDDVIAKLMHLSPKERKELMKQWEKNTKSPKITQRELEEYDFVKKARERVEQASTGKERNKAIDDYKKAKKEAKKRADFAAKSKFEKAFAGKDKRLSTVGQAFKRGIMGGLIIALTNALGAGKDIAISIIKAPFKFLGKFSKKHPLLALIGAVGGGAVTYFSFFNDEEEPEKGPVIPANESVFTPGIGREIVETAKKQGVAPQKEPKTYDEQIAAEVNDILSATGVI
jgi:hypothetical protein